MFGIARKRSASTLRSVVITALLAGTIAVVPQGAPATAAGPSVFVNEIHYDNTGDDEAEFVEIAGPAGTDLSGWSVELYNGNGGALYNTIELLGTIPDQQAGFGTLGFLQAGLQNGSPDGLALVDGDNIVIQFLSYEGSFTAMNGLADGMTSTDIGVTEGFSTPLGDSLQLQGSGIGYDDFTWLGEMANTFGAPNTGQTFGGAPADPVVVINEVDYDQESTDTAEFVELKNVGTSVANLGEFTLELVNGNGASVYDTIALPDVSLAAGDYFVVCANAATVANCDLDDGPDTNFIQNGAPDAVALNYDGALIDTVSYEGDTGTPYTEGSGTGLEDDPAIDSPRHLAIPRWRRHRRRTTSTSRALHHPGRHQRIQLDRLRSDHPDRPTLVINEVDYDQPGTDTAEFVELKNTGSSAVDLGELTLELVNGSSGASGVRHDRPAGTSTSLPATTSWSAPTRPRWPTAISTTAPTPTSSRTARPTPLRSRSAAP